MGKCWSFIRQSIKSFRPHRSNFPRSFGFSGANRGFVVVTVIRTD